MKNVARATELNRLLKLCNFPSLCLTAGMKQEERIKTYNQFKENKVGSARQHRSAAACVGAVGRSAL